MPIARGRTRRAGMPRHVRASPLAVFGALVLCSALAASCSSSDSNATSSGGANGDAGAPTSANGAATSANGGGTAAAGASGGSSTKASSAGAGGLLAGAGGGVTPPAGGTGNAAGHASVAGAGGLSGSAAAGGVSGLAGQAGNSGNTACPGLFCEDFESGVFDPRRWSVKTSGGQTAVVQKAKTAHGLYAAQFHALPNVLSYDLIISKNAPAGLRGHHFGRAYFYVTPKLPEQHATLLFAGSAGFPTFKRLEVASIKAGFQLTSVNQTGINANSAALPGTTETYASGGVLPVTEWLCLEWEFNDSPDQARVFVNGKTAFEFTHIVLDGKDSGQVGGFADFGFGVYIWHPATYAFDLYYDDIVLDTKRVGCLP